MFASWISLKQFLSGWQRIATFGLLLVLLAGNIAWAASPNTGDIEEKNRRTSAIYAQGNIIIDTQGILQNKKSIAAGQNTNLTAQSIESTGTISAGADKNGTLGTTGDLTITSAGKVTFADDILAAGNIQVTAADNVTNNGAIYAKGNVTIETQGALQNANHIAAGQNTSLTAQSIQSTNKLGAGVNKEGNITGTTGDLTITATGAATLSGITETAGNVTIQAANVDLSTGIINAKKAVAIIDAGRCQ